MASLALPHRPFRGRRGSAFAPQRRKRISLLPQVLTLPSTRTDRRRVFPRGNKSVHSRTFLCEFTHVPPNIDPNNNASGRRVILFCDVPRHDIEVGVVSLFNKFALWWIAPHLRFTRSYLEVNQKAIAATGRKTRLLEWYRFGMWRDAVLHRQLLWALGLSDVDKR